MSYSPKTPLFYFYRFIKNDCRGFNNVSYTRHLRQQYVVASMEQEILEIFFYDVLLCSSYAFLRLERSLLRWRRRAVRRRFVCLYFMNVGQLKSSSGNSAPNWKNNHHLTILVMYVTKNLECCSTK